MQEKQARASMHAGFLRDQPARRLPSSIRQDALGIKPANQKFKIRYMATPERLLSEKQKAVRPNPSHAPVSAATPQAIISPAAPQGPFSSSLRFFVNKAIFHDKTPPNYTEGNGKAIPAVAPEKQIGA